MKKAPSYLWIAAFSGVLFFLSCKKELSCEGCAGNNQPPIAHAGSDTSIRLPQDSILLDGGASTDADGKISEWQWARVSGPASFALANGRAAKTTLRSLRAGSYQFELKVTDDKGASARDTIKIIVDSVSQSNHPPVACAGTDQTITLPVSTTSLDGSCSADPDNNLVSYQWKSIAGPASFTLANAGAAKTEVTNLVEGSYRFELTVTDAGGLSSKDTVQLTVTAAALAICDKDTVTVVRGAVSVRLLGQLSKARFSTPATVANKLVFRGGDHGYNPQDDFNPYLSAEVDVYDVTTGTWSASKMTDRMVGLVGYMATDNHVLYNDRVDIQVYNANSNQWSSFQLPFSHDFLSTFWGRSQGVLNNKIFFTGITTQNDPFGLNDRVNIYNVATGTWAAAQLSEARIAPFPVMAGKRLLFAGGRTRAVPGLIYDSSAIVDIYDDGSGRWSVTEMPAPSSVTSAAGTANTVVLAPADHPEKVFIYDLAAARWSEHRLSVPRRQSTVVAIANKILVLAGSIPSGPSNAVDIYDVTSGSWTTARLDRPAMQFNFGAQFYWTGVLEGKLLVMTQFPEQTGMNYVFNVYDPASGNWSVVELKSCFKTVPIIAGNSLILGGGEARKAGRPETQNTAKVWQIKF